MELLIPSLSSVVSLTILGAVFGLLLSVAKIRLNVERDPRYKRLLDALPGANCGGCGEPGCAGYAFKILQGESDINQCPVGGHEVVERLAVVMGREVMPMVATKARVHCQGGSASALNKFVYDGPRSCAAAQQVMGGFKVCQWGCLGLGDCVRVCQFGAIAMGDAGLPVVNRDRCTGCGKCVDECPRSIITLVDESFDVHVMCLNREKAPVMKKGCSAGCIACNRCVKACKEVFRDDPDVDTAIQVIDFVAVIDYRKCINCGKCAEVCPQNVIEFTEREG